MACLLCSTIAPQAQDERPDTSWIDQAALQAGEVVWRTGKASPKVATINVAVLIRAPAPRIWSILTACEIAPEYVPHVTSCSLIDTVDNGRSQLFQQTVKPAFFIPSFEHVFRLDYEPYRRINVHRVSGPIAHMEGIWWLVPQSNGLVLLIHDLELDPGIPVPRFFVRSALRHDLPRVLGAVRSRAEAEPAEATEPL